MYTVIVIVTTVSRAVLLLPESEKITTATLVIYLQICARALRTVPAGRGATCAALAVRDADRGYPRTHRFSRAGRTAVGTPGDTADSVAAPGAPLTTSPARTRSRIAVPRARRRARGTRPTGRLDSQ